MLILTLLCFVLYAWSRDRRMLRNGVLLVFGVLLGLAGGHQSAHVAPAAVVILGAQLIGGKVPPLLRARLDRALQVYRDADDPQPLLIPSGGQGVDESRPEGEGMAEYLLAAGVASGDVRPENRAVNTEQNLLYSAQIQREAGRPRPMLVATNNYHVLRSALLARKLRRDAEVVGARNAWYFVPSAFLREFVAILKNHILLHALLFTPFVLLAAYYFFLYLD